MKKELILKQKIDALNSHPLLTQSDIFTEDHLKIFMEHHVFAVWDFMCIVKKLQSIICPSSTPWYPNKFSKNGIARLINEIVMFEESDEISDGIFMSHFELYLSSMKNINAKTDHIEAIVDDVSKNKPKSFDKYNLEPECYSFLEANNQLLNTNQLHIISALFTYGRETTLPGMFQKLLLRIGESSKYDQLKLYLKRHIDVDSNRHGPLSLILFNKSCESDDLKYNQAMDAAIKSIEIRYNLWTGIHKKIDSINN
jgi:hypothetical protein